MRGINVGGGRQDDDEEKKTFFGETQVSSRSRRAAKRRSQLEIQGKAEQARATHALGVSRCLRATTSHGALWLVGRTVESNTRC